MARIRKDNPSTLDLIAYFERRARENQKRAESKENEATLLASERAYEYAAENLRSSYYFSGKAEAYKNAALKAAEHECQKSNPEEKSWPYGW